MKKVVAVIDYGSGNLHSVCSAIQHVSPNSHIVKTSKKQILVDADHIIFPGVGAMGYCINRLQELDLTQTLLDQLPLKPVLAICVGMQSLLTSSEENDNTTGFNFFSGELRHFSNKKNSFVASNTPFIVPHMGWNQVNQTVKDNPLWHGISQNERFYFVHSYYATRCHDEQVIGNTDYAGFFPVAFNQGLTFGIQFHPEKSQTAGLKLIQNFIDIKA